VFLSKYPNRSALAVGFTVAFFAIVLDWSWATFGVALAVSLVVGLAALMLEERLAARRPD
jgi:Flp pilus assembly protein TadB